MNDDAIKCLASITLENLEKNSAEIIKYHVAVKNRYAQVLKVIKSFPEVTLSFWRDETIKKLSSNEKRKLDNLLLEINCLNNEIDIIVNRIEIYRKEHHEQTINPTQDSLALSMSFYACFDELLRLSAFAMKSMSLSDSIMRLLERHADEETNAAARQHQEDFEKKLFDLINVMRDENHIEHATTREIIEDQHRHSGELWAIVPECVRAIEDMAKTEQKDGKNIASPGNINTLRINISRWLNEHEKRRKGTQKKPYFQIEDIADAAGVFYKEFLSVQYLREFEMIGIPASQIPKPKEE